MIVPFIKFILMCAFSTALALFLIAALGPAGGLLAIFLLVIGYKSFSQK